MNPCWFASDVAGCVLEVSARWCGESRYRTGNPKRFHRIALEVRSIEK